MLHLAAVARPSVVALAAQAVAVQVDRQAELGQVFLEKEEWYSYTRGRHSRYIRLELALALVFVERLV